MEPGPKTKQLIAMMRDAANQLRAIDHEHWGRWLDDSAERLAQNHIAGIAHFRAAFGGMGSLSDVMAPPELEQAFTRIAQLAAEIEREAEFF